MDPGDILAAVSVGPAQPPTRQSQQNIEHTAAIGAHRHGRAKHHLPGPWDDGFIGCLFPRLSHVDTELPGGRDALFRAAQDTCRLVVRRVEAMGVDRSSARLQPNPGRRAASAMACPTARVELIRESLITRRFLAVYRQLTLRPAKLITASDPSISAAQSLRVSASHRTTRQAAFPWPRLSTTTSWPSATKARASRIPTCPVPPGITIFM